jgi:hypothetical protein
VFFPIVLFLCSQLVSYFIESSLPVSITLFIAFLNMPMSMQIGLIFILLAFLVGWSEIFLLRHT